MEIKASSKFIRISPRKITYFPKFLRNKKTSVALEMLEIEDSPKKKEILIKLLKSAIANAKEQGAKEENLYIKDLVVSQGPMYKRRAIRSRGRADIIRKKTSHITVVLKEKKKRKKRLLSQKRVKQETKVKSPKP